MRARFPLSSNFFLNGVLKADTLIHVTSAGAKILPLPIPDSVAATVSIRPLSRFWERGWG